MSPNSQNGYQVQPTTHSLIDQSLNPSFAMLLMMILLLVGSLISPATLAQSSPVTLNTLTVEVEHESGQDVMVQIGQAGDQSAYRFTLAQTQDPQFIQSQLSDLAPEVMEVVQGALLRIHRSEVLVNSDRVDEVEVEWVSELCNDTNADCESIIQVTKDDTN